MAGFDIFDTIETLRRSGNAFCVATVLRTADATSAKAGAKAAVTHQGDILGHLGGACVTRAVRRSAESALAEGVPRMIRIKPSEKVVALVDPDGVETFKSGCPSGGTVDVLIEPYRPEPRLIVFGETPIASALAAHASLAGYRVHLSEEAEAPGDIARFSGGDLADLAVEARDFIVVASQGKGDLTALRSALATQARHVSMVASHRKAQALCDKLKAEGVDTTPLARLKSPAGLDISAIDPHEIAISILAEIILWRNTAQPAAKAGAEGRAPDQV